MSQEGKHVKQFQFFFLVLQSSIATRFSSLKMYKVQVGQEGHQGNVGAQFPARSTLPFLENDSTKKYLSGIYKKERKKTAPHTLRGFEIPLP